MIGDTLSHYRIVEKIGAGGMGEVFRAVDTRLDRPVAVKILPSRFSTDPELKQRFEREARVISNLSHPHICTLHDIGHEDGVDFLVMEYLEGETLADRLVGGPLPRDEVLRFGAEIAEALDAAHGNGIVHRDLKPGNVMLTDAGVKLLDFGLAKLMEPEGGGTAGSAALATEAMSEKPLTGKGAILGTFRYMAPEQLEGREVDARTDIFALGAVLYEMATGAKAFEGDSQASLIAAIMERDPPSLSSVEPMTPPALDWTVRKCLAKSPADRWQSARDVADEIRWIAEEGSQAGIPKPIARRRRLGGRLSWTLAAVFAVAALALGVLYDRSASREVRVVRAEMLPPEKTTFTLNAATPGPVSVSPDGRRLVFAAEKSRGRSLLYVRELDAPAARPIAGTEGACYPFWSPDSRNIAFFADNKLRRIAADGGIPASLCDAPGGKGGTWSRDGVILFAPDHDTPIHRVPAVGGEASPITKLDESRGDDSHRFPVFLPDGRRFLYFVRIPSVEKPSVVMIGRLDGEDSTLLMDSESNVALAGGHLLYTREGTLMAHPFDENACAFAGDAFPIAESVRYVPGASLAVFSASQKDVLAYVAGTSEDLTELVIVDVEGEPIRTVGEPAEHAYAAPQVSPDERSVATTIRDPHLDSHDVWIYDLDRGFRTRLTFDPANETRPTWSPDSRSLVFSSNRGTHYDLYRVRVTRPDSEELLLTTPADKFAACWTPDGRFLVYESEGKIWALPLDGGEPFPFVSCAEGVARPCLSPDGKWLAYGTRETGRAEIFVTPFPEADRRWQVSVGGGFWPMWTGDLIAYVTPTGILHLVTVRTEGAALVLDPPEARYDVSHTRGGTVFPSGTRALNFVPVRKQEIERLTLMVNWTAGLERP